MTACHEDGGTATAQEPPAAQEPAIPPEDVRKLTAAVRAEPAPMPAEQESSGRLTATGELVAFVESELVPRQGGRVGRVLADEGDAVDAGQPLLELETEYFELDERAAEAEDARAAAVLREAARELERKQTLVDKDSIARAVYDRTMAAHEEAAAARELARARLDLARQRRADAVLRSPLAGVVVERRVDVGESLQPTTVAFVLVQSRPLKLRFRLPERYLPAVRRGDVVRAFFDPYPDTAFTGEIHRIGAVIDPASRSLEVEALLANRDGRLRPGLFARVEVDLEGREEQGDGGAQVR
jgi:RND family efflux transporter MFP subunit